MQLALLDVVDGGGPVKIGGSLESAIRRRLAGGAWVDYRPQWLMGHSFLFDQLRDGVDWRQTTQELFELTVETPRLIAGFPNDGGLLPILRTIAEALSSHYGVRFDRISGALYRDGRDSVAWHRDREHRERTEALVAIVSLGSPRPFLLRPYRSPGVRGAEDAEPSMRPSLSYRLGWGDLLVMGGTAQRVWQHAVPKVRQAEPRVSIMFRHDPELFPRFVTYAHAGLRAG